MFISEDDIGRDDVLLDNRIPVKIDGLYKNSVIVSFPRSKECPHSGLWATFAKTENSEFTRDSFLSRMLVHPDNIFPKEV